MLFLKILAVIVIIVLLVCSVNAGADISYVSGQLKVSAKVCGLLVQIYPRKPKKKPEKPKEENPEENNQEEKKKKEKKKKGPGKPINLVMSNDELLALLKKLLSGIGRFTGGINVDRFMLHYTAGGKDPYSTAVTFGYVNSVLCALAPVCSKRFRCKDLDVRTEADFTAEKMQLDLGIAVVLRIGAVFSMVFTILFGALWILVKNKVRLAFYKRFDRQKYTDALIDESAATKLLRSMMEKKRAAQQEAESAAEDAAAQQAETPAEPETEAETKNTDEK